MIFFQRFTALSRHYTIYNFIQEKLVNINKNTGMQTVARRLTAVNEVKVCSRQKCFF